MSLSAVLICDEKNSKFKIETIMRQSFLGMIIAGLLLLVGAILFIINYNKIRSPELIIIILVFSVAISSHSISHSIEELYYGYNPMGGAGRWGVSPDKPIVVMAPHLMKTV